MIQGRGDTDKMIVAGAKLTLMKYLKMKLK